jgi:hypothetical protein
MKIQVDGSPHLFRDKETNAIINTNRNEYENYLYVRENKLKEIERISKLESELQTVKDNISEIKDLILGLYNK